MGLTTADGLSKKTAAILQGMLDSGDSQSSGVADILNAIAENGGDQNKTQFLVGCAEEIIKSARYFIDEVSRKKTDDLSKQVVIELSGGVAWVTKCSKGVEVKIVNRDIRERYDTRRS